MSISVVARKLLWGLANNQCAFNNCEQALIEDSHSAESDTLVAQGVILGEEAHIRSGRSDGPRFEAQYPSTKIDNYENLILLCPTHHTLIDKHKGSQFATETLISLKKSHENAVRNSLTAQERRSIETEIRVAAALEAWNSSTFIEEFDRLTFGMNQAIPTISQARLDSLLSMGEFLLAKIWPSLYPRIAQAFDRHRLAIALLTEHVLSTMEPVPAHPQTLLITREYKRIGWNPTLYPKLLNKFLVDCVATWWLTQQLAITGNEVIQAIHEELDPLFRFESGALLTHEGDGIMRYTISRLESVAGPRTRMPSLFELLELIRKLAEATETGRPDDISIMDIHFTDSSAS